MCTGAVANRSGFPSDGAKADVLGPPPVLGRSGGGTGAGTMTGFAWRPVLLSIKPGGARTAGSGPLRQINNSENQCHCDQNCNHDLFPCSHKYSRNGGPGWPGLSRSAQANRFSCSDMPDSWLACSTVRYLFACVVPIKTRRNLGFVAGVVCALSNIKNRKRIRDSQARPAKGAFTHIPMVRGRDGSYAVDARPGMVGSPQIRNQALAGHADHPFIFRAPMNRVLPVRPLLGSDGKRPKPGSAARARTERQRPVPPAPARHFRMQQISKRPNQGLTSLIQCGSGLRVTGAGLE